MENKPNIRKNPFANPSNNPNSNIQESFKNNYVPNNNYSEVPPRGGQINSNPPPKPHSSKPENESFNQNKNFPNIPAFSTNQNQVSETDNILREYESYKGYNSSKGFIRPTTER